MTLSIQKTITLTLCAALTSYGVSAYAATQPLNVVASFSILADIAKNVGQENIAISTLVGPNSDAHTYEPKPNDAVAITKADVVLVNGLGFEGFMTRMLKNSDSKAAIVTVSEGIERLKAEEDEDAHADGQDAHDHDHDHNHDHDHAGHQHGEWDPHAWNAVPNAIIYTQNIATAFCQADKAHCTSYQKNAQAYIKQLNQLEETIQSTIKSIPENRRTLITSHDAFNYFAHHYGMTFLAPVGLSTDAEASAADVAHLIEQIKKDKASALFVENISNPRLIEQISAETGVKIGGELYSDALSEPDGVANSYITLMQHNIATIQAAINHP